MMLVSRYLGEIDYLPGDLVTRRTITAGTRGVAVPVAVEVREDEELTQAMLDQTDIALDHFANVESRVRDGIRDEAADPGSWLADLYERVADAYPTGRTTPARFAADLVAESLRVRPAALGVDADRMSIVYVARAGFIENRFVATTRDRRGLAFTPVAPR